MPLSKHAAQLVQDIEGKLNRYFRRDSKTASKAQLFRACAMALRDRMAGAYGSPMVWDDRRPGREVHYLSLEFLMGRSLQKNTFNLGLTDSLNEALVHMGIEPTDVVETEPDAGLGNGGLGRLAACYLDSMTTLDIPATGYSICYEYGIFKQKIVDGQQIELPDPWMEVGDVWLLPRMDEVQHVRFGGHLERYESNGRLVYEHKDYTEVLAVPMDMPVAGYKTSRINTLRLWDAKSPTAIDMNLFSRGEYMKALEQNAMAEVINKVLYPADDHFEGKLLRLRQQYFFVSATAQSIVARHKALFGTLENFHLRHVIQINDTHPTLVIPELMRIFLDEEGMSWEEAWVIVTRSVAYTNHTVLSEALECWPQNVVEMLLPRIWQILCEINDRFVGMLWEVLHDEYRVSRTAVIWDGQVRMANLCVYACFAVNGVSGLHSYILREDLFRNQYSLWPGKFYNVTNGVDHRRWLAQVNPRLHGLICRLTGSDDYLLHPMRLKDLENFAKDGAVQGELAAIKRKNKEQLAGYIETVQGVLIDPGSLFDVQVKRLHEYKRQLLNVLHILSLYLEIKDNPRRDMVPRTFLFGAKAASGYYMAKRIIRLIGSVADHLERDPAVRDRLKVVFLENYRVSLAERLMPASEVSEQISTAGKEASGTGNMKFMLNGALTVGTLDGANVEISEFVGPENIFIFGLRAHKVAELAAGGYNPAQYVSQNPRLQDVLDLLNEGMADGVSYGDIVQSLLIGGHGGPDPYFLLADFAPYCDIHKAVDLAYRDKARWNEMSLRNIANAGHFAADRSVSQYARHIWNVAGLRGH